MHACMETIPVVTEYEAKISPCCQQAHYHSWSRKGKPLPKTDSWTLRKQTEIENEQVKHSIKSCIHYLSTSPASILTEADPVRVAVLPILAEYAMLMYRPLVNRLNDPD